MPISLEKMIYTALNEYDKTISEGLNGKEGKKRALAAGLDYASTSTRPGSLLTTRSNVIEDNGTHELFLGLVCHAPPVPDWFEPVLGEKPQAPQYGDLLVELKVGEQQHAKNWLKDPCFDIDAVELVDAAEKKRIVPILKQIEARHTEYHKKLTAWNNERPRNRLVQWPIHYASLVVAEITKPIILEEMSKEDAAKLTAALKNVSLKDVRKVL